MLGPGGRCWNLFILIPLTGGSERSDVIASLELTGGSWSGVLGLIVTGWLVGGFAEELFFRGYLIPTLQNLLGGGKWAAGLAALISILWFSLSHRYQGWMGVADAAISGLLFTTLFLWRGRLTAPIIAHGLFDMLVAASLFALYRTG